jgi:RNA recognition motif-containing protein
MSQDILVDGIPPYVTEAELRHLFSACGEVLAVSIQKTLEGVSLGVARVQMSSPEEAEQVLRSLHRVQISGRTLLVFPISQGPIKEPAGAQVHDCPDGQDARLQCPSCSTFMLHLGPAQHGHIEWLCPACRTTRGRTIPSRQPAPPADHPREDSHNTVSRSTR